MPGKVHAPSLQIGVGSAYRQAHAKKGLKDLLKPFQAVSSRRFVSSIERDIRATTIEKLDQIAQAIGIHPLAPLAFACIPPCGRNSEISAFELMLNDLARL